MTLGEFSQWLTDATAVGAGLYVIPHGTGYGDAEIRLCLGGELFTAVEVSWRSSEDDLIRRVAPVLPGLPVYALRSDWRRTKPFRWERVR